MTPNNGPTSHEEGVKKLASLIKKTKICMMTTLDDEGRLHSRPMAVQQMEFDGDLWFFTGKGTAKAHEIERDSHVNVSFINDDAHEYVSVSGRARLVQDREKAKELWNPFYTTWFPKGLDDPDLTLMKLDIEQAEYWDSPNGAVVYLIGVVKAMATGKRPDIGEHAKVSL